MSGTVTQMGKLCKAAPSVITLVALNTATKRCEHCGLLNVLKMDFLESDVCVCRLFKHFGLSILPPPLVGMFIIFFGLLSLRDADAARLFQGPFEPSLVVGWWGLARSRGRVAGCWCKR